MAKTEVGIVFKAYDQTSRQLASIGGGMDRFRRQLIGLGAGYLSVRALVGGIESIGRAAMQDETALNNLTASVGAQSKELAAYAKQLSQISRYTAGDLMAEMSAAKNMGVVTDQLDEVTTAAIGLAKAYRMDLSEAVMLVTKASQGETGQLKRRGIILDDTMTAQEKYNALLRLGYEKFALETESLNTAAGAYGQYRKSVDGAKAALGQGLLPTAQKTFQSLATWLNTNQDDVKRWGENVAKILTWSAKKFVETQDKIVGARADQWIEQEARVRYRIETGDILGGGQTTRSRGIWAPMETTTLPLQYPEAYQRIVEQLRRENQDLIGPRVDLAGPSITAIGGQYPMPTLEDNLDLSPGGTVNAEEKQEKDRLAIYRQLAGGMGKTDREYFAAKEVLLEAERRNFESEIAKEKDDYEQFTKDKLLLDRWYAEQSRQLDIERGKASEDFFAGFHSGVMEMQDELQTLGELGAESAKMMRDAWVSGTWDMIAEGRKLSDVLRSIGMDMARLVYQQSMSQLVTTGMGWLGGAFGGGGSTPGPGINAGSNVGNFELGIGNARGTIIDEPISFSMHGRRQRGGEAGDEGLLPLGRDAQGRLGVHVAGDQSGDSSPATEMLLRQLIGAVREGKQIFVLDETGSVKQELRQLRDTRSVLMR